MAEKLDEKRLAAIVNSEFRDAMGAEGLQVSQERQQALDYYLRKPLGNEVEGESKVVTSDVADVVDGIMPSLLRIFTTADNLCYFEPVGPEDEEAAAQESDVVTHVFFKENPAFLILYYWFMDALLQKNGITMAWWDQSEEVTQESYANLTEAELPELLDDPELEAVEREEIIDEPTGEIRHNIKFNRVSKKGRVRVDNVPPNEYRISSDARSVDPKDARMEGRERLITRSELLAMGFDPKVVEKLPAEAPYARSSEEQARKDKSDEQNGQAHDKSQELVLVRECYLKVDFDGDGRSELRQIFVAGGRVLSNEVVDRKPFHVICPRPLPHKHFGRSVAELVMDIQEVATTLLRQVLNNLYHTNNPRHGVNEMGMSENTLDDLLTNRPGGVVRFGRNPNESYTPITTPFTAGSSFPMLEYFEKVKRDRTGISSDGEGLSPDALKNIQTTVLAQAVDLSKQKIEAIARIFAETGIKSLFLHIHELLLKHQDKEKSLKLRNQWVKVSPTEWRTRTDMSVNIGLGIGTREQNLLHLDAIWQKQSEIVQNGGMNLLVTPQNLFRTASEIVKNARLQNPELYFRDPGNEQAPPPPDEMVELQKQQQELEARRQQLDQMRREIETGKLQLEQQRMALEHQREVAKLEEQREQREDKLFIEVEKLRNQLTEIELKYSTDLPEVSQ